MIPIQGRYSALDFRLRVRLSDRHGLRIMDRLGSRHYVALATQCYSKFYWIDHLLRPEDA